MSDRLEVVVFEDSEDDYYRQMAYEAAQDANWHARLFDNPLLAAEHLDGASALITALGNRGPYVSSFPAKVLIEESNARRLPRAILSAHPNADLFIRMGSFSKDIVVSKTGVEELVQRLSGWLAMLSEVEIPA